MPNRLSHKLTLLGVAALLTMGSMNAAAADRCEQRIHKAEMNLRQAEQRHGEHSRQAENKRRKLEEVRANCHNHR